MTIQALQALSPAQRKAMSAPPSKSVLVQPAFASRLSERPHVPLSGLQSNFLVRFGSNSGDVEQRLAAIKQFATAFQPRKIDGYVVNNSFFNPLQVLPNSQSVQKLTARLQKLGTFDVTTNPKTGLIRTSETTNEDMLRQWFTDSCMVGNLQRRQDPNGWRKSMITNAAALNTPEANEAVKKTVANPDWFRKGDVMDGVFHIYLPETVHLDEQGIPKAEDIRLDSSWFNQKRLESQGLILSNLVKTVRAGVQKQPWGFTPEDLTGKKGEYVAKAITNMARYVMAVNTNPSKNKFDFHTPSASSWEEAPFKEGMTSDAANAVVGAQELYKLLYKDKPTAEIQKIRETVKSQAPEITEERLKTFIRVGRAFVNGRTVKQLRKGADPIQTPARPYDTSLALLAASDYVFVPKNKLEDAQIRFELVVKNKQALLGDYGMRRYNEFELGGGKLHDSYLNKVYPFPDAVRRRELGLKVIQGGKDFGSTDASSLEALQERQALSSPDTAAQWGIGLSASLQALTKAKKDVLLHVKDNGASSESTTLLKKLNTELTDLVNRNVAALPGPIGNVKEIIRADGTPVQAPIAMEAWETSVNQKGELTWVPGQHTLPWHGSQLFDGLKRLEEVQALEESMAS